MALTKNPTKRRNHDAQEAVCAKAAEGGYEVVHQFPSQMLKYGRLTWKFEMFRNVLVF